MQLVYPQKSKTPEIEILPVQGNISMLAGAGGNITVQAGRDGILLVDTGVATMSDTVLEAIRTLSKRQITYIINTDDRSDHIGGNENFAKKRPAISNRQSRAGERVHHCLMKTMKVAPRTTTVHHKRSQ